LGGLDMKEKIMTFQKLTKQQDALVELIANFSAIEGTTFSSTSDGRWFSWYDSETDKDWLHIVLMTVEFVTS